ncbi:ABC transporter permease [Cellulomonas bogoriensis]|uniref:ABC3 transporter permease C-terminal domain-containing protein n=1 Tax=Cellulomonas bogoriensis 69B4 = DSM 16987 TaxID=1386082 RepID=A0A0A0C5D3_9CELL|nr:FtsX-like permease family protein [Cellulomonas bogoriensis]KGM14584.1 hypothetical protein N869_05070 [Cellulomonas bogoriensis 69B4 = DSM 16987]
MTRAFRTSLADLRARPLRSFLTGLSMLVGVLAVVGVSAADQLSTGYVIAAHEQLQGREATYAAHVRVGAAEAGAVTRLSDGIAARIGPQDAAHVLLLSADRTLARGDRSTNATVHWVDGDLEGVFRRPLVQGERAGDAGSRALAVVVNEELARVLGLETLPTTIELAAGGADPHVVVVTGVLADADDEPVAYGVLTAAARVAPDVFRDGSFAVHLTAGTGSLAAVTGTIKDAVSYAGLELVEDVRRVDTVERARESAQVVERAFVAAALAALTVAVIGILNIGLASLAERARELVVRRALGARRVDVFSQVLGSSMILAMLVAGTALVAVLLGVYVVAPAATPVTFIADPVQPPWGALRNGVLAAVTTALLGAAAPAVKATRLPVALALRA